jgi:hypothetical protein
MTAGFSHNIKGADYCGLVVKSATLYCKGNMAAATLTETENLYVVVLIPSGQHLSNILLPYQLITQIIILFSNSVFKQCG